MNTSGSVETHASGCGQDIFPNFANMSQDGLYGLRSTLAASPDQFSRPLPISDSNFLRPQPSSAIYPTPREARYPANFAAVGPNSDAHTPFDFHDRLLQTDRCYPPFFNPRDPWTTPSVMSNAHQPSARLNVDHYMVHNGYPSSMTHIATGPTPADFPSYFPPNHVSPPHSTLTYGQSYYHDARMVVNETQPFDSAMNTPYRQVQPALAGTAQNFSPILPDLPSQAVVPRSPTAKVPTRRNSRGSRSVASPPYHPTRTFSSPVQSASPREMASHTCEWIKDDGTICGAPITRAAVSEHLAIHGVEKMSRDYLLSCMWFRCRLKGGKNMMNRESIVRHVREKHLGCRRTL